MDAERSGRTRNNTFFFQSCASCQDQVIQFRGIRPDDINGREPLSNPERGFRLEHIMMADNLLNPFHRINYSGNMEGQLERDENNYAEKTKLTQVYFYLTRYLKTKIPDHAFSNMQSVLDGLKKKGYKAILLFAYRYDDRCQYETYDDIKRHLLQLKPFLEKNAPAIYAFQAGFLGLWGEWHHSGLDNSPFHKKVVIRDILAAIPQCRKMQVRETIYKTNSAGFIRRTSSGPATYFPLSTEDYNRIGFQNGFFVMDQGANSHWDYRWPDDDYFMVEKEAIATIVDGEMPYDGNGHDTFNMLAYGKQGGWEAAKRMRIHAHSSFSVVHNFKTNIAAWKTHYLSASQFKSNGMVVTNDYFHDQQEQEVPRTAYEYIRDHLGYRFQLDEAKIPQSVTRGDSARFSIRLKNFGFAPLINKRPVYLVLIDEQNNVTEFLTAADPRLWMPAKNPEDPGDTFTYSVRFSPGLNPGQYKVGLWLPDDADELKYNASYAIRFANGNMEWWQDTGQKYLVNIMGTFRVN